MDAIIRTNLDQICSEHGEEQFRAYQTLMEATDQTVDWTYEAWDELVAELKHPDNHVRAIAAQLLANLAKSDPQKRILKDFAALLEVTRDERFVTARHCMQSIWKVGAAGKEQQAVLLNGLARRFAECVNEKNITLIRYDITVGLRNLYNAVHDESIRQISMELIDSESDLKYRKKYTGVWRGV